MIRVLCNLKSRSRINVDFAIMSHKLKFVKKALESVQFSLSLKLQKMNAGSKKIIVNSGIVSNRRNKKVVMFKSAQQKKALNPTQTVHQSNPVSNLFINFLNLFW